MAFLDKLKSGLKSVTDRVTGNYGKVTLELDKTRCLPGDPVTAKVHLESTGDLKISNIVLSLQGTERLSIRKQLDHRTSVEAAQSESTLNQDIVLEGSAFELKSGESKDFEHTLTLPADLLPSYKGKYLCHQVEVSVRVDVPWGVDLTAQQELSIPSRPPYAEQKGLLSVKTDRLQVNVEYGDSLTQGEKLSYTAAYQAFHEVQIRQVLLRARSVETFEARVRTVTQEQTQSGTTTAGDGASFSEHDSRGSGEGSSHGPDATEEVRTFHEELDRTEMVLWPSQILTPGSQAASMGSFAFPEEAGVTYFGKVGRHEMILELEVALSDGRTLKEEAKVAVCGSAGPAPEQPAASAGGYQVGPGTLTFKFGTPNPIPVKEPDLGWLHVRLFGEVVAQAQTTTAREDLDHRPEETVVKLKAILMQAATDAVGKSYATVAQAHHQPEVLEAAFLTTANQQLEALGFTLAELRSLQLDYPEELRKAIASRLNLQA
jgi:hypothetical protein